MPNIHLTPHSLRRGLVLLMKVGIVVILALLFSIVLIWFTPTLYARRGHILGVVFYALLFSVISIPYDGFKIGILRLRELQFSFLLSITITNVISYIVLALISRAIIDVVPMLVLSAAQMLTGYVYYAFANFWYFKLYPSRDTVIVYTDSAWDKDVAKKFEAMQERYNIKAICKETDGYAAIIERLADNNTCILGQIKPDLRHALLNYCYENNKRVFVMPAVDDIIMHNAHVTQIGDSLVYLVKNRALSLEQMILKRAMDIVLSVLILLVTSPFMLVTALLIKIWDRGPVFFRQLRYTRNEEVFNILKFRSMIVDAEKDGAQLTTQNDSRITAIGRFMRKTRIDEIPQFINVIKGDMSIVGPRAERVENYDEYVKHMPEFAYRSKVKSGITGYAQIYGKYNTSFEDKARMDIHYIENYSLRNDIKLLFATMKVIFKIDATEGFASSFFEED